MKALIVEDEMIIAIDLKSLIIKYGIECIGIANDLVEANTLMTNNVKIVFMDINLHSKEDGFEVAEILREDFDFYLVFISASNNQFVMKRAETFKNCEFIKKPFNYSTIQDVIEKAKSIF